MNQTSPFKRAIIILADGARPDVLNAEMQTGRLPHLARLCDGGTNQTMLTCFPSTTGPAYLPYVTGCFPGTCNVPGIRWFDKPRYEKKGWGFGSFRSYCGLETSLFDRDMNAAIRSAWEIFPQSKSIFNGVTKGLNKSRDLTRFSRIWYYYYAHLTDRWSFIDQAAYRRMQDSIRSRDFDFSFVVFPSIDEFSHRSSPTHPRVRGGERRLCRKAAFAVRRGGTRDGRGGSALQPRRPNRHAAPFSAALQRDRGNHSERSDRGGAFRPRL